MVKKSTTATKPSAKAGDSSATLESAPVAKVMRSGGAVPTATDGMDADAADMGEPAAPAEPVVTYKIKELLEQVTEQSSVNKKDVRKVVEAVLEQLGEALKRGESLSLPGLGRVRVIAKATAENPVLKLRMRPADLTKVRGAGKSDASAGADDAEALADDSEDV